jgi:AcrR family transcriptional regulator
VGKATLYRRFQSKAELAKAVVGHFHHGLDAPADTGSLIEDLRAFQAAGVAAARVTQAPLFLPRMLADAADEPELHAIFRATLVDPRRAATRRILERAVERGEVRSDVDLEALIDLLAAPYLYRLLIDAGDLDGAFSRSETYLDLILNGARPHPA